MFRAWPAVGLLLLIALAIPPELRPRAPENAAKIRVRSASTHAGMWQDWSDDVFERARESRKLVLLDLGAVWCHWCHVMEETTYRDAEVHRLLGAHYVTIRVDQDARPDLSNRYEDYGWPATILFDSNGRELAKLSGYIPPERMREILKAFADDPTPGPSARALEPQVPAEAPGKPALSAERRAEFEAANARHYDSEHGGWGRVHKWLFAPGVEYALRRAQAGDAEQAERARTTLDLNLQLIDPVWGGVYQYSHGGVWTNPHFEKIMRMQADNMRLYARAYALWREPRHLQAARDIRRFLTDHLRSPDGAFYASMDADLVQGRHAEAYFALDDAGRRKQGLPRVDTHLYSRENGSAIEALCELYAVSGDTADLDLAYAAVEWIRQHRLLEGGGYAHGERDPAGPYLGDTLAMGQAYLSLFRVTRDTIWLNDADLASGFIDRTFSPEQEAGGYATARGRGPLPALPNREENLDLARFALRLFRVTGQERHRLQAERALKYLARPEVHEGRSKAGVLLAFDEFEREPLHVTVVGMPDDFRTRALIAAAVALPGTDNRIEHVEPGARSASGIKFPKLDAPAAFLCAGKRCSLPLTDPDALRAAALRPAQAP